MSVLLPNPKELEKKQDKQIAIDFVKSLDSVLANNKNIDDIIDQLKKYLKDLEKNYPYLVGLIVGILIANYFDLSKELEKKSK